MKRVATVSGQSGKVRVSIRVTVDAPSSVLTRDEIASSTEYLTDKAMRALAGALFVGVPLSRQRIR